MQPAVESDNLRVIDYDRSKTTELRRALDDEPHMIFEAHSTDYQTVEHLSELVEDRWAALKVGPSLTFALREVLFALVRIEDEVVPVRQRSQLRSVDDTRMLAEPSQWQNYYLDTREQQLARTHSYSDRLRYYWPAADVQAGAGAPIWQPDRPLDSAAASQHAPARSLPPDPARRAGRPATHHRPRPDP